MVSVQAGSVRAGAAMAGDACGIRTPAEDGRRRHQPLFERRGPVQGAAGPRRGAHRGRRRAPPQVTRGTLAPCPRAAVSACTHVKCMNGTRCRASYGAVFGRASETWHARALYGGLCGVALWRSPWGARDPEREREREREKEREREYGVCISASLVYACLLRPGPSEASPLNMKPSCMTTTAFSRNAAPSKF